MNVFLETVKQSDKPAKRSYMLIDLGQHSMVYDAAKQDSLIIEDRFLNRDRQNNLSIAAYKSEKQYLKYTGQKGEKVRTAFNVIMIIFTILMIILSFGLYFAYFGKKADPALKFYYSFKYDALTDLKVTINNKRMSMQFLPVNGSL